MDRQPADEGVDPALAGVWARNLPLTLERLGSLERAAEAIEGGEQVDRSGVAEAAHRLAGSLGSFGLARGSELARRLERRFEFDGELGDPEEIPQLVSELRRVIEG